MQSGFTWKHLVFWKSGRLREVVATGGSTVFVNLKYGFPRCKVPKAHHKVKLIINLFAHI